MSKDSYEIGEQNNVVYKISCNCGKCYVGQTKHLLRITIDEHFKNFNLGGGGVNSVKKGMFLRIFFGDTDSVHLFTQFSYNNATYKQYFSKFSLQNI